MRKTLVLGCGTALLMGLLTTPANAASAPGSCPQGFEGPVTFEQLLMTPQIQRALADGVYDAAHVQLALNAFDNNGDAMACWKSVGNLNQFRSIYAGNYVDNNAAPKDPK
jgi:hypothetical protein